jgi:uncharacterized membrane protein
MSNPIKSSLKTEWFSVSLIILSFVVGFYLWQHFPSIVPTHWGINGEVNGWSGPLFAAFFLPALMLTMYLLFLFMPYIDPKKDQYAAFSSVYHNFKDLMVAFLFILYFMTGLNGLGYQVDISFYVPIMVGALFIIIGIFMRKVKMNWFVGVRTPWTMSSETVWEKTNRLSFWVFVASGLLMAATALFTWRIKVILFILSIGLIILILPIYSFILYTKEKNKK